MDNLASLSEATRNLRRRLWAASQTWAALLDRMFSSLLAVDGDEDPEAFGKEAAKANIGIGRSFAAMFLLAGVRGLSPIKGDDALAWAESWKAANPGPWQHQVVKLDKALPSTYGSELAGPLWAAAMAGAAGSSQNAEDLLQEVYIQFLSGLGQKIEAHDVNSALKYVKNMIQWRGKNRLQQQRKQKSLTKDDDEDAGLEREIVDDRDLDALMDEHNARVIVEAIFKDPGLKRTLESIHPDALQYLQLNAQGYDDVEILGVNAKQEVLGEPLLKHPVLNGKRIYPALWNTKKQQMFHTIREHFKQKLQHHPHMAGSIGEAIHSAQLHLYRCEQR